MFAFNETLPSGKLSRVLYYILLGYIVSLFLKHAPVITNIFMIAFIILTAINISPSSYLKQFSIHPINIGLLLFFAFQCISVLLSSDKASGVDILRVRMPLFLLPMFFCFVDFEQKTWCKILFFYTMATVIASVIGFSYGIFMAITTHNSGYLYNDNISDLLIGKQAAYFSFQVDTAIFTIIYLLSLKKEYSKEHKSLLYISLTWLIFINYMLASTMSTISMSLILISTALFYIVRKKKILEGLILVFGLVIALFILNNTFPKALVRFQRLKQTNFKFDNTNPENHFDAELNENEWSSASTRLALWQCGSEIWLKHPIMGTGLGDLRNTLKEKYTEKQFWFALNTKRNLHNQYLDILVSMGILGLLFFLVTFIIYPIKTFITKKQTLALNIIICLALCLFTENMFDRYQGEVLIALLIPLSIKIFDKKETEKAIDYLPDTY